MIGYKDFDTGYFWTLEELKKAFSEDYDSKYADFDEYLDDMLSLGRQKIGGLEEVELRWVFVEDMTDSRGLFEQTILPEDDEKEAFDHAVSLWDEQSDHDKKDRSDAWLGLYAVDDDGIVDLDSEVYHLEIKTALWYAVMQDREDSDWGYGSYDREEAEKMSKNLGENSYIAVIQQGNDPVCIEVIEQDSFGC